MDKITDDRTTNKQLEEYAKKFNLKINVLMNDQFRIVRPGYYILNLQNSGDQGSHWVGLICTPKDCFYFDSFGSPPTNHVHLRLKSRYNKIYMNNLIIQSLKSEACGWFALGLLLFVHLHPKLDLITACDQFLNMFDDDTERNYQILKKYFQTLNK